MAAIGDFSHRASLPSASLLSYPVILTKPRRIMRYSGGHPKFRERCDAVAADGYRELVLA